MQLAQLKSSLYIFNWYSFLCWGKKKISQNLHLPPLAIVHT